MVADAGSVIGPGPTRARAGGTPSGLPQWLRKSGGPVPRVLRVRVNGRIHIFVFIRVREFKKLAGRKWRNSRETGCLNMAYSVEELIDLTKRISMAMVSDTI